MKMKELKMYEAPKMEVVELSLEDGLLVSTSGTNGGMTDDTEEV